MSVRIQFACEMCHEDQPSMETPFRPLPNLRKKFFTPDVPIEDRIQYLTLPEEDSVSNDGTDFSTSDFPITEAGLRQEKLNKFAEACSWAIDHVYFGGAGVASRLDIMKSHKITHVVNCVKLEHDNYFKNDLDYLTLYLQDSGYEDILAVLYDVFDFIEEARDLGGRVFVHCSQGVSRSAALVIAYIMLKKKQPFDITRDAVKRQRGVVDPNVNFCTQLSYWEKRFHQSQGDFLRIYRIKAQSKHQPNYLIPQVYIEQRKGGLQSGFFDPRGAFIVHCKHHLYIWIGKKCPIQYVEAARRFTKQLQKYENAPSVLDVLQEEESEDFISSLNFGSQKPITRVIATEQEDFTTDYELFDLNLHHSLPSIPWSLSSAINVPLSTRRVKSGPLPE